MIYVFILLKHSTHLIFSQHIYGLDSLKGPREKNWLKNKTKTKDFVYFINSGCLVLELHKEGMGVFESPLYFKVIFVLNLCVRFMYFVSSGITANKSKSRK